MQQTIFKETASLGKPTCDKSREAKGQRGRFRKSKIHTDLWGNSAHALKGTRFRSDESGSGMRRRGMASAIQEDYPLNMGNLGNAQHQLPRTQGPRKNNLLKTSESKHENSYSDKNIANVCVGKIMRRHGKLQTVVLILFTFSHTCTNIRVYIYVQLHILQVYLHIHIYVHI